MRIRELISGGLIGGLGLLLSDAEPLWREPPVTKATPQVAVQQPINDNELTQDFLDYARRNEKARTQFLSLLFQKNKEKLPHCKGIVYDPGLIRIAQELHRLEKEYQFESPEVFHGLDRKLAGIPSPVHCIGRGLESHIYVNFPFFDMYVRQKGGKRMPVIANLDEAINILVDHEGTHIVDAYEGIRIGTMQVTYADFSAPYPRKFLETLEEARAYYNQLKMMSGKNISHLTREEVMRNARQEITDLTQYTNYPQNTTVERIANAQLKAFHDVEITPVGENKVAVHFKFLR